MLTIILIFVQWKIHSFLVSAEVTLLQQWPTLFVYNIICTNCHHQHCKVGGSKLSSIVHLCKLQSVWIWISSENCRPPWFTKSVRNTCNARDYTIRCPQYFLYKSSPTSNISAFIQELLLCYVNGHLEYLRKFDGQEINTNCKFFLSVFSENFVTLLLRYSF